MDLSSFVLGPQYTLLFFLSEHKGITFRFQKSLKGIWKKCRVPYTQWSILGGKSVVLNDGSTHCIGHFAPKTKVDVKHIYIWFRITIIVLNKGWRFCVCVNSLFSMNTLRRCKVRMYYGRQYGWRKRRQSAN